MQFYKFVALIALLVACAMAVQSATLPEYEDAAAPQPNTAAAAAEPSAHTRTKKFVPIVSYSAFPYSAYPYSSFSYVPAFRSYPYYGSYFF